MFPTYRQIYQSLTSLKSNRNYLKCFEIAYKDYVLKKEIDKADKLRNLAINIAENSGDIELIEKVKQKY